MVNKARRRHSRGGRQHIRPRQATSWETVRSRSARKAVTMPYFKSVIVGIVAALIAVVIWVLAVFILPVFLPFVFSEFTGNGGMGASGIGASVESGSILAVALVGFLAGFVWYFRKVSRFRAHSR
jgi:hypothetical protein